MIDFSINKLCTTTSSQACVARGTFNRDQKQYFDSWCTVNCLKYPPTCPDSICQCL